MVINYPIFMPDHIDLSTYRQQFPALNNKLYFNYGGQGVMPRVAEAAIIQSYEYLQQIGPFSGEGDAWITRECAKTRACIASELGVKAENIALTESTTFGCNIPLWGIDWQPGDHLLLSDCEHQGVVAAVAEISRRFQVEVSMCKFWGLTSDADFLATISSHLRPTTRLIVLSHVLWNTGQLLPLADIVQLCRQYPSHHPVRILVDAAQSVGVLPLNLAEIGVDFYAFTGHKWWCGPEGVGAVYIHPEAMADLHPVFIGWRGVVVTETGEIVGFKADARRFEVATSAYPIYAGWRESVNLHHEWGSPSDRYHRIRHLSQYLWQKLAQLSGIQCLLSTPPESGLISFQIDQKYLQAGATHTALVKSLESQNIMLRTIRYPDCARACVHYFTLESEIDQLVEAIKTILPSL